jgi:hypothetical protein
VGGVSPSSSGEGTLLSAPLAPRSSRLRRSAPSLRILNPYFYCQVYAYAPNPRFPEESSRTHPQRSAAQGCARGTNCAPSSGRSRKLETNQCCSIITPKSRSSLISSKSFPFISCYFTNIIPKMHGFMLVNIKLYICQVEV